MSTLEIVVLVAGVFAVGFALGRLAGLRSKQNKRG